MILATIVWHTIALMVLAGVVYGSSAVVADRVRTWLEGRR